MTSSLEVTDQESAAVAVAPRVQLKNIEEAILSTIYLRGTTAALNSENQFHSEMEEVRTGEVMAHLSNLTLCLVVMKNGFTVVGKSAPASPENFNVDLGRKFAYEDAVRQIWPLMGYALRDKLMGTVNV